MNGFLLLLRRELSLAWGKGGGPLLALTFYAAAATLLPFSVGAQAASQRPIAVGSAWLALALASLLSLERLFERDFDDGALDLLTLGPAPLEVVCFTKCLAQWLAAGLPLAVVAPLFAVADFKLAPLIVIVALTGGIAFSFLGGIGAALSIGSRRGGVLIAVIVLPLFAPPVIFGAGVLDAYAGGLVEWKASLALLGAYALAAAAMGPFAMAAAVRNAIS
jgi:heme exporter protein B